MLVRNPYTHDTRVEKEARTLRDAGYDVTVVAEAADDLPLREARDGIGIVRVPRPWPNVPLIRFVRYAVALRRALVDAGPDILHAHDSDALGAIAGAARELHAPFIYDAHDLWLGRPRRGRSRLYFALNQLWYRWIEERRLPRAAAHITVSPPIARHLERRYRLDNVDLVPNYPERDSVATQPASLRELASGSAIPADAPIVLYLGALMAERGLEHLVAAMRQVRSPAHLVLLGAGGLAPVLLRQAQREGIGDRVHVMGPIPSERVAAYAASATIGVSPIVASCLNYRYSLPNKLFQYMAAGLPVIASDFPQVREVVEGSGAGWCVDTSRSDVVAAAIDSALEDPARARAAGEAGRRAVVERFHWEVAADTLLSVYRRVTERRSGGPSARPPPARRG